MAKPPLNSELEVPIEDTHPRATRLLTDANQSHLLNPLPKHDMSHVKMILDDDDTSMTGEAAELDCLANIIRDAMRDIEEILSDERNAIPDK